ncbi:putative membrane protein [Kineococcus xinjiangensis]|uniref:Putative membrane protein n=1 Tax=Kineococcus xinjiangensis TaxID=512762 RepID=A0A2S6IWR3_9ACTN|nr:DUF1003 domain-containing protein [Kineococcus xinjiangensis]PPK98794.1 putative membrane protein [Kineococcus xinjiangensis]
MAERGSWTERRPTAGLDTPREARRRWVRPQVDPETFGRIAEGFARFMGTARFLVYMTAFVTVWLAWNTFAPVDMQFDPEALNYTLMTLMLSLQASYAAPLILLAQNRQTDRDRVIAEQDRARDERALADTEYLTREVAALRIALRDVATRDFVRAELRSLLEEVRGDEGGAAPKRKGKGKSGQPKTADGPGDGGQAPGRGGPDGDGQDRPAEPAPQRTAPHKPGPQKPPGKRPSLEKRPAPSRTSREERGAQRAAGRTRRPAEPPQAEPPQAQPPQAGRADPPEGLHPDAEAADNG